MPIKDPEKRRQYQRQYRRKKRQQQAKQAAQRAVEQAKVETSMTASETAQTAPQVANGVPGSVSDVQAILGAEMVAIRASGLDKAIVARTVATLANAWLKAAEVGELADRIEALECRTAGPQDRSRCAKSYKEEREPWTNGRETF